LGRSFVPVERSGAKNIAGGPFMPVRRDQPAMPADRVMFDE